MPGKRKASNTIVAGDKSILISGDVKNSTIILGESNAMNNSFERPGQISLPKKDETQMVGQKLVPFLCHAKEDRVIVSEFSERLKKEGWIDPWFDEEDLLPGQMWQDSVILAVHESHVVIIFLSKIAVAHEGFFQRELNLALDTAKEKPEGTIFIIPIRLEVCDVPVRLLPYQYVDYFGSDAVKQHVFGSLLQSLKLRAQSLGITI
jgi:hypothetical protein